MSPNDTIEIQLTKGQVTIIDAKFAYLAEKKWLGHEHHTGKFYAKREQSGKIISLHRVIMSIVLGRDLESHEQVDHINGDTLNNCVSNLRIVNANQNQWNRAKNKKGASGFKGVSWYDKSQKWRAAIGFNGKKIHLGYFDDPQVAYKVYCEKAKELYGEYAKFE